MGDDERVDLGEARPLEQLVHLAHRGVAGEAAEVGEEVILLCAEEVGVLDSFFVNRLVPERPNVPGGRGWEGGGRSKRWRWGGRKSDTDYYGVRAIASIHPLTPRLHHLALSLAISLPARARSLSPS